MKKKLKISAIMLVAALLIFLIPGAMGKIVISSQIGLNSRLVYDPILRRTGTQIPYQGCTLGIKRMGISQNGIYLQTKVLSVEDPVEYNRILFGYDNELFEKDNASVTIVLNSGEQRDTYIVQNKGSFSDSGNGSEKIRIAIGDTVNPKDIAGIYFRGVYIPI